MKISCPKFITRFLKGEEGSALVEFGIVVPILMLFLAVIIDGGRIAWAYQATAAGVRDASRMVARIAPDDLCAGGSVAGYDALVTKIVSERLGSAEGEIIIPRGTILVDVTPTVRCVTGGYRVDPAAVVEVRAQIRIDLLWGNFFGFFGTGLGPLNTEVFDQSRVFGV